MYNSQLESKVSAEGGGLLKQLISAKRMLNEGRHGEEEQRVCHVLFNIDLVRNVEQFFHMGDLQEGQRGRGGAPAVVSHLIGGIQLHWQRGSGRAWCEGGGRARS